MERLGAAPPETTSPADDKSSSDAHRVSGDACSTSRRTNMFSALHYKYLATLGTGLDALLVVPTGMYSHR